MVSDKAVHILCSKTVSSLRRPRSSVTLILSSTNASNSNQSNNLLFGKVQNPINVKKTSLDLRHDFKRVLENVNIKRAFGELNNIFQDEFNKILSHQSTNVRFFLSHN